MEEEPHRRGILEGFTYDALVRRNGSTPTLGMLTMVKGRWEETVGSGFGAPTSAMFLLGYRL